MAFPHYQTPFFGNNYQSGPLSSPLLTPSWNENPYFTNSGINNANPAQYGGASPYGQNQAPGFWSGLNSLVNPAHSDPRWGNPVDNNQAAINSVASRPMDAAVWAGQRLILPAAVSAASYRAFGVNTVTPGSFAKYWAGPAGNPNEVSGLAKGADVSWEFIMGRNLGVAGNVSRSVAGGVTSGALRGVGVNATVAGGAGAFVGGTVGRVMALAGPQLIAQVAMTGIDQGLIQPYINNRRTATDLQANFQGVSFGDAQGNPVSGGGLGGREAYRMAGEVTRQGTYDHTFSRTEYTQVADMVGRSGLLDTANSKQISSRIGSIAEQIKMVMAISKDPSFQSAIEEISKLQMGGASVTGGRFSQTAQTYGQLGRSAAMAGTSIQRMMSVVGDSAQSMYQQQGMTPYLGQLAAGNIYASMAAGQRTGVISAGAIARMGGIENGTLAALSGQMQSGRSTAMQMALYNENFGGRGGNAVNGRNMSLTGVIAGYSGSFSQDPMSVMGRQALYGDQMIAMDIQKNGGQGVENLAASFARQMPGMKRNTSGQYDAEQLVPLLQSQGMTREQIIGFFNAQASSQDPAAARQGMRGSDRYTAEQARQFINQNKLYGGAIQGGYSRFVNTNNSLLGFANNAVSDITERIVGGGQDGLGSMWDRISYGSSLGAGRRVDDASTMFDNRNQQTANVSFIDANNHNSFGGNGIGAQLGELGRDMFSGQSHFGDRDARSMSRKINELAKSGDANAIAFLSAKDENSKGRALTSLIANNKEVFGSEGSKLLDSNNKGGMSGYVKYAMQNQTGASGNVSSRSIGDQYVSDIDKVSGASGHGFTELQGIGQAVNVMRDSLKEGNALTEYNVDDVLKNPQNAALAALVGDAKRGDAVAKINGIVKNAASSGLAGVGIVAAGTNVDDLKKDPNLIADPKVREKFKAAMASGDERGMQQALLENNTSSTGGNLYGTKFKNTKDLSDANLMGEVSLDAENMQTQKGLQDKLKKGLIDYSGYQNSMNAMDMKKSTDSFSKAVDKFGEKIDNMGNGSGSSGSTTSSGKPSWWNPSSWTGSSDNQRVQGK